GIGFTLEDGVWIQDDEEVNTLESLSLAAYSEAYFELANRSEWVAKVFALGDRIRLIYEGVLIQISDEGIQTLDELLDALDKQ
ncbi:MAG: hypothetical protein KDK21_06590, partial [Mesotoga sp.]|nr:hypothetical protein [Mesotoga sp.]